MNKKVILIIMLMLGCMVAQSSAQKSLPPSRSEQIIQKVQSVPDQIKDLPHRGLRAIVGYAAGRSGQEQHGSTRSSESRGRDSQIESNARESSQKRSLSERISEKSESLKDVPSRLRGAASRAFSGRGGYERVGDEPVKSKETTPSVESNVKWKKTSITKEDAEKLDSGLKRDNSSKDAAKTSQEQAAITMASNAREDANARMDAAKKRLENAEKAIEASNQYKKSSEELKELARERAKVEGNFKKTGSNEEAYTMRLGILADQERNIKDKQGLLNKELGNRSIKSIQAEADAAKRQIKLEEKIVKAANDREKAGNTIKHFEGEVVAQKALLITGTPEEKNLASQRIKNYEQIIKDSTKDLNESEKIVKAANDRSKAGNTIKHFEGEVAAQKALLVTGNSEEKNLARQRIKNYEQIIKDNKKDLNESEKILGAEKPLISKKAELEQKFSDKVSQLSSKTEQATKKIEELRDQAKDLPYRGLRTAVGYAAGR